MLPQLISTKCLLSQEPDQDTALLVVKQTETRPRGKGGGPKLSIDYLLEGNSVKENAHLRAFSEMPFVMDLVRDSRFKKFFNMKARVSDHP